VSRPTAPTRAPHSDADLDRLLAVFDGLMHRLMASHAPELNLIDLTMSQTKALYLVVAEGHLRMSELAGRLGVTSSTATGVVDGLVSHGLLIRQEDPADRRQVVVTATPEAEATLQSFRELNSRRMRELLAHVPAEDLAVVERSLRILDAAITSDIESTTTTDPKGDLS
jgi:DNA-binding MarR family transcriptional regulator